MHARIYDTWCPLKAKRWKENMENKFSRLHSKPYDECYHYTSLYVVLYHVWLVEIHLLVLSTIYILRYKLWKIQKKINLDSLVRLSTILEDSFELDNICSWAFVITTGLWEQDVRNLEIVSELVWEAVENKFNISQKHHQMKGEMKSF